MLLKILYFAETIASTKDYPTKLELLLNKLIIKVLKGQE